jgi:arsenite methyltransferase
MFLGRWAAQAARLGLKELEPSEPKSSTSKHAQIQTSFGYKWIRQPWWGMEGESAKIMEEWLLPRYGWPDRSAYQAYLSPFRTMLDAGCGLGRETLRMAKANRQGLVVGLELSECVDEAAQHARRQGVKNAFYVQADLMVPPFKPRVFEFVFSEGVLHHTPDTHQAFKALVALLGNDGEIAFYVYRKKPPLREFADDYVRERLQALPPEEVWSLMESLTRFGKALADLKVEITVPEDIAVLDFKAGRYDLQRFIHYSVFKCFWNDRMTFDENVLVNYDWYHPRYAWRHTIEEVMAWIEEAGLVVTHQLIDEPGITIRAKRAGS